MPTITVDFVAKTGSFVTDTKRAEAAMKKTAASIEADIKRMGAALGAVAAATAGAVAALGAQAIKTAAEFDQMSKKVGVSVESLSTLAYAAQQSDVSLEALQGSLVKISKNAVDAANGTGAATDAFATLGIEVKDASGKIKSGDTLLREIADKFAGFEDGATKTALAVKLFGRAGADLVPLLNEGSAGIEAMEERARALGLEISTNTAREAERFGDLVADLGNLTKGFGNDIAEQLLPSLNSMAERFVNAGIEGRKASEGVDIFANGIKGLIAFAVILKNGIEAATNAIAAQVDVMAAAGKASLALARSMNPAQAAADMLTGRYRSSIDILKEFKTEAAAAVASGSVGIRESIQDITDTFEDLWPTLEATSSKLEEVGKDAAPDMRDLSAEAKAAADAIAAIDKEWADYAKIIKEVQREHQKVRKDWEALKRAELDEALADAAEEAENFERWLSRYDDIGFDDLLSNIDLIKEKLEEASNPEMIERLQAALGAARQEALLFATDALGQGIESLKSMASEGSSAYRKLEAAQAALNIVTAIGAIANQGMGDPYTAFARIAAMAAMMAQLVGSLGSFGGGGGSDSAAARQATQGRGTVLGDAEAQSQSIANAVEITAEATQELVGINRGMLNALQAMQRGISGASAGIARTQFESVSLNQGAFSSLGLNPIGGLSLGARLLDSIFGGGQELIDRGLLIRGGSFGDVMSDPRASAYQTIRTDGGWFGSDRTRDRLQALSDSAISQIQLILTSIGDAVREGALALGLSADDINAAIEAFRVEQIRISTMDLSGAEAQAELEAAFSAIFDGLAGSVVPFISQFQRVGEGLGETLVRVATSVQVTEEALFRLGLSMDELDPEHMAQVSVALIEAAGGIDEFIQGMQAFMNAFAPEAHLFSVAQDELTRALEQVGLAVPETRDGMWELMQSLDATTESGQQQIAALLRLAGVADNYYDMLEQQAEEAEQAAAEALEAIRGVIESLGQALADEQLQLSEFGMSDFARRQAQIQRDTNDALAIAMANGASGAELLTIRITGMERAATSAALAAMTFTEQLEEWNFEDALAGMSETEQQLARNDRIWGQRYADAVELFGEGSAEATAVISLWNRENERLTNSAQAAVEVVEELATAIETISRGEARGLVGGAQMTWAEILGQATVGVRGDGLTEMQRAINEVNARFDRYVSDAYAAFQDAFQGAGLYGNPTVEELRMQLEAMLEQLASLRTEAITNIELEGIEDVTDAIDRRYERELDWLRQLGELQDSLLLDEQLSTLSPTQQLAEAQRQYEMALVGAAAGDEYSRQIFDQAARAYLEEARDFWASSEGYVDIFDRVTGDISQLMEASPISIAAAAAQEAMTAASAVEELRSLREDGDDQTEALVLRLEALEQSSRNSESFLEEIVAIMRREGMPGPRVEA